MDAALEPVAMNAGEYALYSLLEVMAPITPTRLSELSGIPSQTMSRMLGDLDAKGHLHRAPNPADARSTLVSLNRRGLENRAKASPHFKEAMNRVEAALGSDTEVIGWSMQRLNRALAQVQGEHTVDLAHGAPPLEPIRYTGEPLDDDQLQEVREFIDWIRHRDQTSP